MILYNKEPVNLDHFPDGTLLMKQQKADASNHEILWQFEKNEELVALYFLTKHLKGKGVKNISLRMPYIPNARQDRVKKAEDVFTLKYFCDLINELEFSSVTVLDPHSYVSEALLDRLVVETPKKYVEQVLRRLGDDVLLFFPDEGAKKRYSSMFDRPYVFGMKMRDWSTGEIKGLEVVGQTELIPGSRILIVDDICSRGGTFYYSAKALKESGAKEVYLYISHCENSILEGKLPKGDELERIFTTDSIFTETHERIEVIPYE